MYLFVLDCETTGLDPEKDAVIELGYALYDTDDQTVVTCGHQLFRPSSGEPLTSKIKQLTGITDKMLADFGDDHLNDEIKMLVSKADYFVGHNARSFDRYFLNQKQWANTFSSVAWIDTMDDIPYPDSIKTQKLTYLCLEHGIFMPNAHRAMFDCLMCVELIKQYDLDEILARADSPRWDIIAHQLPFEEKYLAKDMQFKWDGERKHWHKHYSDHEIAQLGYVPCEKQYNYVNAAGERLFPFAIKRAPRP